MKMRDDAGVIFLFNQCRGYFTTGERKAVYSIEKMLFQKANAYFRTKNIKGQNMYANNEVKL